MVVLFICLGVYILSAILWWKYINIAHSKGGSYELVDTDWKDAVAVFCPFFNTFLIFVWFFDPPRKKTEIKCDKFFKIKK